MLNGLSVNDRDDVRAPDILRCVRLLIVEDEVHLAETLDRGLTAEGFDCDVVHDGAEGLWQANSGAYAAIILDLLLPTMNGYTVARRLREENDWTPILILTAKEGEYDLVDALDCGADDFLSKPFSFVVLTARLRALIRRGHVAKPATLTTGGLCLDPFSALCTVDDTPIQLTSREASVLGVLMRRHPGAVARHEILTEVWGSDFNGDPNIVDQYISHLRRKLTLADASVQVTNVRSVGFRIEVGPL